MNTCVHRTRYLLPGLLLIGFALRVYQLAAQSLWYDEGVSWYLTRMSLPALTVWTADDIQPPLYYVLLWGWVRLAGTSEYALRFPSVLFGALTVPLMWTVTRRLFGRPAAWLAALLAVVSPLQVYYAQEARMYTLLTFLGLLSSYLLLRLVTECDDSCRRNRAKCSLHSRTLAPDFKSGASRCLAIAYVLVTAAALYTHYFAFFLLVAHAVYVGYRMVRWGDLTPRPPSLRGKGESIPPSLPVSGREGGRGMREVLLMPFAILILYVPWLPFLVSRYGMDTSYWPGALKLGEVARKLVIAFCLGETVKEHIGIWLVPGYGIILVMCVMALTLTGRNLKYQMANTKKRPHDRGSAICHLSFDICFLLAYLLVPVALILLLAYRTPKFNPRYAMLASPALMLFMAGGLSSLITGVRSALGRVLSAVALVFILATSAYALGNWFAPYRDNQFNKADFRITAQIVRQRIQPNETVLLSSGHMFPAWAYYYGWQGWHALPPIEVLDVNAALDMTAGAQLDELLAGRRGAWLVRWQNETTDPFDVLPLLLGAVGEQDDYGQFWHMELRHYALPADARFDLERFITHPVGAAFGGQVRLLGMRASHPLAAQSEGAASSGGVASLVFVWQASTPMDADYTILVHLLDAAGKVVATADHLPARPTSEWPVGRSLPDRIQLALPPGLTDGAYQLEVGLYDASAAGLPRLAPVVQEASGQLPPGERVLIPVTLTRP